jgi:hypothetical protein
MLGGGCASVPAAQGGVVLGVVPLATAAAAANVAHEWPSIGFWLTSLMGAAISVPFVLSDRDARTFARRNPSRSLLQ